MKSYKKTFEKSAELSRVEFLKKLNENLPNQINNYQKIINEQSIIDNYNDFDDSLKYAYNTELPNLV